MMRKTLLMFIISAVSCAAKGQSDQQAINDQVWKPFTKAIMAQDVETFIQLHSKEVIRVERDSKQVMNYEQYKDGMEKSWPGWKRSIATNKETYVFELRFLERVSNGETINEKGEKRMSFGQFHVALRKENGVWKILVDSDSANNNSITETMFLAAKPLE
jgi:ketosteroid isomerase-like protein